LAQVNHIPGHQLLRGQIGPRSVTADTGHDLELLARQSQRSLGAAFLHQAKQCIQDQQAADDRRFDSLAEKELQDNRGFQQPGNRGPETFEEVFQRLGFPLDDCIRTELLQPNAGLGRRQASATMIRRPSSRRRADFASRGSNHSSTTGSGKEAVNRHVHLREEAPSNLLVEGAVHFALHPQGSSKSRPS
jgi:hypothetical protein